MTLKFVPSIKQKIIKGLAEAKQISQGEKNHPIYRAAHKLENAILFRDVYITKKERQKAVELKDIEHLPYSDFMVLLDSSIEDGSITTTEKESILLRLWRQGDDVYSAFFYRSTGTKASAYSYVLIGVYRLDPETKRFKHIHLLNYVKQRDSFAQDLEDAFNPQVMEVIYILTHFQTEVKSDPTTTHAVSSKVKVVDLPKYIEYTLDLSKPRTVSRNHGGSHASPMEHTRRGHWRTSKLGKRYFVRDTVVNKGSERGKIVKDYIM